MAIMDLVTTTATRALPQPMQNGYTMEFWFRGKAHRMASGALVRERTNTSLLRRFTIEWTHLTATQRTVVDNAVTDMLDGSSATFTDPANANWTVVLAERDLPVWKVRKVKGNTELRYSGALELEQVP